MRKILIGMILGGVLTYASLWMLEYWPSKSKSASSIDVETLKREFPNKTFHYVTEEVACEMYLYGDIALIRNLRSDILGSPRKEVDQNEVRAIWDQFEKLPGLQEFKNRDPDVGRLTSTHDSVYINDVGSGYHLGPTLSYSIPKDEKREGYRIWRDLIETTIRKQLSEDAPSNGE